ncbi:MAG: hypothetical protein JO149_01620 [Gammaproteobacteria bacterium]|nr:hypothetical protein [Gammaproteobacteria bacterium]
MKTRYDVRNIIPYIRKTTPRDLALTQVALEAWNEKMRYKTYSDEEKWDKFKKALPYNVRQLIEAIDGIDQDIRRSAEQEATAKGKNSYGVEEVKGKWIDKLKESIRRKEIDLDEKDLYEVYSKIQFLYDEILDQYTPHGEMGKRLIAVNNLKYDIDFAYQEYYQGISGKKDKTIDHVFKIETTPEQINQLNKIEEKRQEIINRKVTDEYSKEDKKNDREAANKQMREIHEQIKLPYDLSFKKMTADVQAQKDAKISMKILMDFISAAEKVTLPLGKRKDLFKQIKGYFEVKEFDLGLEGIKELHTLAIKRNDKKLATLCDLALKGDVEKLQALSQSKNNSIKHSLMTMFKPASQSNHKSNVPREEVSSTKIKKP